MVVYSKLECDGNNTFLDMLSNSDLLNFLYRFDAMSLLI